MDLMQLLHIPDESLPSLAWCLQLEKDSSVATLVTGDAVQVDASKGEFFEGAWAGDYASFAIDQVHSVFGSGGKLTENGVLIVPPSHTCERIQYMVDSKRGATTISNSLAFLLQATGDDLDPTYSDYIAGFERIVYGLRNSTTELPTKAGRLLYLHYFHNLVCTCAGDVSIVPKPSAADFETYAEYRTLLEDVVRDLVSNANDPRRTAAGRYAPLCSISTGYDSPAAAVLAANAGCRRAVTFAKARPEKGVSALEDSGAIIAGALGMTVEEYARDAYQSASAGGEPVEAEFLATGMSGEDVIMKVFEPALTQSVFFSGFHGDKIWDKKAHIRPNDQLERGDLSGASLGEFRLRVNFVHVPVPFIAGRQLKRIDRVSNHAEMQPWSIGGDYDRPIPRRLVEQKGVARTAFGTEKKAATALIHLEHDRVMSENGSRQSNQWMAEHPLPMSTSEEIDRCAARQKKRFFLMRVLRKLKLLRFAPSLASQRFAVHDHSSHGLQLLRWGLHVIEGRYKNGSGHLKSAPRP